VHKGELTDQSANLVTIEPDNIVLSAVKKCEHDDSIIIRFYNTTNTKTKAKLIIGKQVKKAYLTNLNEEQKGKIIVKRGHIIELKTKPFQILTVKVVV
jgi:alpha-mannosidase